MDLKEEMTDAWEEALTGLIDGAQSDLRVLAQAIADDIISMMESGEVDPDLMSEWQEQIRLIGEANRLRANSVAWETAAKMARIAARAAIAAASA